MRGMARVTVTPPQCFKFLFKAYDITFKSLTICVAMSLLVSRTNPGRANSRYSIQKNPIKMAKQSQYAN